MHSLMRLDYPGPDQTALPQSTNTYTLFSTVDAGIRAAMATYNFRKLRLNIQADQDGTLVLEESKNRGATWTQVETAAVSAVSAPATVYVHHEWVICYFRDFRLRWINTVNTTVFELDMCLDEDISSPA